MDIKAKKTEVETEFNKAKDQLALVQQQAQQLNQLMIELQGQYKLLSEMETAEKETDQPEPESAKESADPIQK